MAEPLAQAFVRLRPTAATFKAEAEREINTVDGTTAGNKVGKRFGGGVSSGLRSTIGAISGVLLAAGVVKFGRDSVAAYKDAQKSQEELQGAFKRFPALSDTNIGSLRQLNSELQRKTGFDDDATASGQAVLAQFGLTGRQIQSLTPLLQDYASRTGQDLPTAASSLGKAVLGQGRALKGVGINFKDTHDKAKNFDEIMSGLRTNVGGFATDQGKTAAGQSKILSAQFGDLEEKVGSKLVPTMAALVGKLTSLVTFVSDNIGVVGTLIGVIAAAAVAAGIYNIAVGISAVLTGEAAASTILQTVSLGALKVAQAIATAGQWAFNAAMTANPIGLVIAAIALLVVGLIIAWKHSATFRAIVTGAFHGVAVAVGATVGFIKAVWSKVNDYVVTPVRTAISWVTSHFGGVVSFFAGIPGKIGKVIGAVVNVLTSPFRTAFNRIADLWNGTAGQLHFSIPSWVPGIGGKGFSMPQLPHLAMGTKDWMGGFALYGERGPEIGYVPPHTQMAPHGHMPAMAGAGGPLVHADTIQILRGDAQEIAHDLWFRSLARGGR